MSDRFDHELEHKLETKPADGEAAARDVRRIELISGVMPKACSAHRRRRRWSSDDNSGAILRKQFSQLNFVRLPPVTTALLLRAG